MSKPGVGTQQKHVIGEGWSLELRIHNTEEGLMNVEMTDCILAVTNSLGLDPWTSDSLERRPDLFDHP